MYRGVSRPTDVFFTYISLDTAHVIFYMYLNDIIDCFDIAYIIAYISCWLFVLQVYLKFHLGDVVVTFVLLYLRHVFFLFDIALFFVFYLTTFIHM